MICRTSKLIIPANIACICFNNSPLSFPSGVLGMDLQCDQVELHSRSRLKIRRGPSCKISASFHGSCSQKKRACKSIVIKPLIFHTVDPEIIEAEPAEFMWVVQRLTGSPNTRRLVSSCMRGSEQRQLSSQVKDVQSMQQGMHSMQQSNNDSLKDGNTTTIAPTYFINLPIINDFSPSPSSPNPSDLPFSAINLMSLPLSAKSSNSEYSELPLCGSSNHFASSPLSTKACDEFNTARGSPLSSNSSLTTSSEGYHTDNLSTEEGASPYREALQWFVEQGNTREAEEDRSIDFFDFSLDSYYGNYNAAQDEVELTHHSNVFDSFYQ